jgi:hypothetical protein
MSRVPGCSCLSMKRIARSTQLTVVPDPIADRLVSWNLVQRERSQEHVADNFVQQQGVPNGTPAVAASRFRLAPA